MAISTIDGSKGKLLSICTLKCIFYIFHLLPFNNTHILCLLSDVTSYTDSVASHSQSGYPNRKVHVFLFLNWCTNLEKKHPIMKLKLDRLITACYRGMVCMGEQWLRLLYNVIILETRPLLTNVLVSYLALSHYTIHLMFPLQYVAKKTSS